MRKLLLIFIILSIALLISCSNSSKGAHETQKTINNSKVSYFPKGVFYKDEQMDSDKSSMYSNDLLNLNEPSLYELRTDNKKISYRFFYLRSLRIVQNPVVIRVDIDFLNKSGVLCYKSGCYSEPDKNTESLLFEGKKLILDEQKNINLEESEIEKLLHEIEKENFWNLPTINLSSGLDGSNWVIEGVKEGKYHIVDRWSPEDDSIKNLGLMFIELSKEKIDDIY